MRSKNQLRTAWPFLMLGLALLGCGSSGPERYAVSGKVFYNGQPVPLGEVTFEPDASQGNSGPQCRASIQDGVYQTPAGKGAVAGPMTVQVHGYKMPAAESRPGMPGAYPMPMFPVFTTGYEVPPHDSTLDIEVE